MKKNGFTLIEVIVSIVILGIAITGITILFQQTNRIKQSNNIKKNITSHINSVFTIFTLSHDRDSEFYHNLETHFVYINQENASYIIYFDENFVKKSSIITPNYLKINVEQEGEYHICLVSSFRHDVIYDLYGNEQFIRKLPDTYIFGDNNG